MKNGLLNLSYKFFPLSFALFNCLKFTNGSTENTQTVRKGFRPVTVCLFVIESWQKDEKIHQGPYVLYIQ